MKIGTVGEIQKNFATLLSGINNDGVVKSPIYCVVAVFQALGILHVLPRT